MLGERPASAEVARSYVDAEEALALSLSMYGGVSAKGELLFLADGTSSGRAAPLAMARTFAAYGCTGVHTCMSDR